MPDEEKKPKIVSDESWKSEAQKAKEKLTEEKKAAEAKKSAPTERASRGGAIPPANFITLVNSLVVQILYSLGRLGDPNDQEHKAAVNLDLAKHNIDMLGVLEEKTKGNLNEDEQRALAMALHEMRMQYVAAAGM